MPTPSLKRAARLQDPQRLGDLGVKDFSGFALWGKLGVQIGMNSGFALRRKPDNLRCRKLSSQTHSLPTPENAFVAVYGHESLYSTITGPSNSP